MPFLIQTWTTTVDPGGGNPGRVYVSPVIGAGFTHLRASFGVTGPWSGSFRIHPGGDTRVWFNRFPQPASPFLESEPDQSYVTGAADVMEIQTNNGAPGMQVTVALTGDLAVAGPFCVYGTRLRAGASFVYYLTPGVVDLWLGSVGLSWLAPVFTSLWFTTLRADELCAGLPPELPPIDLSTLTATAATLLQLMKCVAWVNVCECVPGAPAPIPPPSPSAPQPVGWPAQPVFPCSDLDVCAAIVAMQQQLAALSSTLQQNLELTTLLQRYREPFAWIRGATHSGLTGSGTFAISRLLGLQVLLTSAPTGSTVKAGNPPYIFDQGWMSVSTPEGMVEERRIAESSRLWFPAQCAASTTFNWYLNPGVQITVTELEAEP